MAAFFTSRRVVVSGRASWALELEMPRSSVAPADDSAARKRRRFCKLTIGNLPSPKRVQALSLVIRPPSLLQPPITIAHHGRGGRGPRGALRDASAYRRSVPAT